MSKLKIAFLTPEFPHTNIGSSGGIGTSIMNLSKGLLLNNCEVSVLVYGQKKDNYFFEDGIHFYQIKNIKVKGLSRWLTQKKIQKLINNLVKEKKVDVVEAPDWTGFSSGIKTKCPLIVKLHGSDTYFCHLDNRPVKPKNKALEKLALQNAKGLLSVSKYTADVTQKIFQLKRNFTVIPNSVDIDYFSFENNNDTSENTILYFGTLIRKKGLLELPHIFNEVYKKNKNAKLVLIGRDAADVISGNSSTWSMMQQLFDKDALKNVEYKGGIPYKEMKAQIMNATICVFPTFAEALPVSWIEAMAMQKAIVASNIGWATEIIDDNINGYLVHPKNHLEFASKIVNLLEDNQKNKQFGQEARKKAISKFSLDIVAKQNIEFYKAQINYD
ncbi:MAG TPA: glycosyltransferase family 4 protein [Flavobacterium lutivivi]|nr:glycosyltransferase family 4 protein [Flavobacterium lutivivi]